MTDTGHISQDDLALYALQTLSHNESAAVREHLSGCAVCQSELARLRGDLAMVAISVDQHPLPAGAQERFARRIADEFRENRPAAECAEAVTTDRSPAFRGAAGLFQPDAAGNGSVVLPPIPQGIEAKAFGVTLEDAAGSKTPTAPILLAGAVRENGA